MYLAGKAPDRDETFASFVMRYSPSRGCHMLAYLALPVFSLVAPRCFQPHDSRKVSWHDLAFYLPPAPSEGEEKRHPLYVHKLATSCAIPLRQPLSLSSSVSWPLWLCGHVGEVMVIMRAIPILTICRREISEMCITEMAAMAARLKAEIVRKAMENCFRVILAL